MACSYGCEVCYERKRGGHSPGCCKGSACGGTSRWGEYAARYRDTAMAWYGPPRWYTTDEAYRIYDPPGVTIEEPKVEPEQPDPRIVRKEVKVEYESTVEGVEVRSAEETPDQR
jgi:hypothetical protein